MGRAIKSTCSHCQREIYFDPHVGVSFDALSSLTCSECGQCGAVLTLNIEAPPDVAILDRLPARDDSTPGAIRLTG
jgi:hypothetical protein